MQAHILTTLFCLVALTDGFFFPSKCPIEKYKSGSITGIPLLAHKDFEKAFKIVEKAAKDCKVHVNIKSSYYQLPSSSDNVAPENAALVVGRGFQFDLRTESNSMLCNKVCLQKPITLPEPRCFLSAIQKNGLTWAFADVITDGTSASSTGYYLLKTNVQKGCEGKSLKRQLLRQLRKMYEEDNEDAADDSSEESKKK